MALIAIAGMKLALVLVFSLFAAQLQSSPTGTTLYLAGSVDLLRVQYKVEIQTQFESETVDEIRYVGTANIKSTHGKPEKKKAKIRVAKSNKPRATISILLEGSWDNQGLFLETVFDAAILKAVEGDVFSGRVGLHWMIHQSTTIPRDHGTAEFELLTLN